MIVDLEQGTTEWETWRRNRRMASESAALLRVSPWFPRNPVELFEVKSGQRKVGVTPAMARGVELEATARALYEIERRDLMVPYTVEADGDYGASLDGLSFGGERILEIKVPFKGTASDLWVRATRGQVPPHYQAQVQSQLIASGAEYAHFAVYAADTHRLTIIEVRHDLAIQARIRAAWDVFWPDYAAGRPPGGDYVDRLRRSIRTEKTDVSSMGCGASLPS